MRRGLLRPSSLSGTADGYEAVASALEQTRAFFDLLFHDDRDSRYFVASEDGGLWSERSVTREELSSLSFSASDRASHYVSRNGFISNKRALASLRQVNSLMLDLDAHSGEPGARRVRVEAAYKDLCDRIDGGEIPEPSMVVDTGRGLQVYYVLERSTSARLKDGSENERGLKFIRHLQDSLACLFESCFEGNGGIEVDSAVYDLSRVSRIPGSYNPKACRRCELLRSGRPVNAHDLHESLKAADVLKAAPARRPHTFAKRKRRAGQGDGELAASDRRLMAMRLKSLEDLQLLRSCDCEGKRELMCFLYYNTAVKVHDRSRAFEETKAYNSRFNRPLALKELSGIKSSVDSVVAQFGPTKGEKGSYPISVKTLRAKLGVSDSEAAQIGLFSTGRARAREAAKKETARRRAARDGKILALVASGLTQKEAAKQAGVSLRTVSNVVAKAKAASNRAVRPQKSIVRPVAARLARLFSSRPQRAQIFGDQVIYCGREVPSNLSAASFSSPTLSIPSGSEVSGRFRSSSRRLFLLSRWQC